MRPYRGRSAGFEQFRTQVRHLGRPDQGHGALGTGAQQIQYVIDAPLTRRS